MIEALLTSGLIAMVVFVDIALRELEDPAVYRLAWIRWRNRLDSALRLFVEGRRCCSLANGIMRALGLPDPQWPLPPYLPLVWLRKRGAERT